MVFAIGTLPQLSKAAASQHNWKYQTPAYGLFFRAGQYKAIRVEAPDIGKEFTDHQFIGRDPAGLLSFDDIKDLNTAMRYRVESVTVEGYTGTCAKVTFYKDSIQNPLAIFIATDPQGAVQGAGLNGYEAKGDWKDLGGLGSSSAVVIKQGGTPEVTLEAKPVHLEANWSSKDYTGTDVLAGKSFKVKGTLWFRGTYTLRTQGLAADYNNDRIVFYSGKLTEREFVGYFIPYEYPQDDLKIKTNDTKYFETVKWKTT